MAAEGKMKSYWWECQSCGSTSQLKIAAFIRDALAPSSWDQALLVQPCPCGNTRRITYEFPRKEDPRKVIVHGIVGLSDTEDDYLPMMWETVFADNVDVTHFDFKYIRGRNLNGLMKPAVFRQDQLRILFELFRKKRSVASFP